jgi:hypothetical protein
VGTFHGHGCARSGGNNVPKTACAGSSRRECPHAFAWNRLDQPQRLSPSVSVASNREEIMSQSARQIVAVLCSLLTTAGAARAADGVEEDGGVEAWVLLQEVPPTAEEELGEEWRRPYEVHGDLRLFGQRFKGGDAVGVRIIVEGDQLGLDSGFGGLFVRKSAGRESRSARGLLDLQLTFSPIATQRARVRLGAGLGALFTPCSDAVGPAFGVSSELRLFGPVGLAGASRGVFWPYRSLDSSLAVQISLGHYQVRLGVRHLYLDDASLGGGTRPESFIGPWLGVGMKN